MSPESAREILLIKSLEAADRDGHVLPLRERVQATRAAGIVPREDIAAAAGEAGVLTALEETRLIARSRSRCEELAARGGDASAYAALAWDDPGRRRLFAAAILVGAFVAGSASNYLGQGGVVNLLAIPIFGLIAWNLAMYAVMLGSALRTGGRNGGAALARKLAAWSSAGQAARAAGLADPYRAAAVEFFSQWLALSLPAHLRALRMVAHGGAMLLAAGVLAGMYLRGLGYEYKAGWESTFLDADAVERFLRCMLFPGSALTGIGIPPGDMSIAQLDLAKGGGEKADQWIHLFAANAALFILVPRTVFLIWEMTGVLRWRAGLAQARVFPAWHDHLANSVSGGGQLVRVLPFHCTPQPRQRDAVRGLMHKLWGGASHVDFSEPAAYGEEDDLLESLDRQATLPACIVLLISLSATPESEAHGYLVAEVQRRLRAAGGEGRLLFLLDENGFRQRFGGMPEFPRRLEERRAAWEEMVKPFGLRIGYFDSDDSESAERLARSGARLVWTATGGSGAP